MARVKNRKNQKFGYSIAIEAILRYIADNAYVNGDLLPSLKDMADMLFDGKLKQVRMAVSQLAKDGVLESHRGRGVFVKDAALAEKMAGEQEKPPEPASSDYAYEMEMPHILKEMPRIILIMVEREASYRRIWGGIVDAFNVANHDFQVDVSYTISPNVHMESDLFQVQSFRMRPYIEQKLTCELSSHIQNIDKFHPNLFGEVRKGEKVFGIPVTAAAYAIISNDKTFNDNGIDAPDGWESFDDYIEYLKFATSALKDNGNGIGVVYNCFVLGYYMALAGILKREDKFEELDFKRPDVQDFFQNFGVVFRDKTCFHPKPEDSRVTNKAEHANNLLIEGSTYSIPPSIVGTPPLSRYLPPPVNPGGYCPLIPHYICVSNRSQHKDFALQFMEFLSSRQVGEHLVQSGFVSGRTDVGLDPALSKYFDHGWPEAWRENQYSKMSKMFNHIFSRWQSGQIELKQAIEMIERTRNGRSGKYFLFPGD